MLSVKMELVHFFLAKQQSIGSKWSLHCIMNSDPECSYDLGTMVSEGKLVLCLLRISLPSHGRETVELLAMRCSRLISKQETCDPPGCREWVLYGLGRRALGTLANVNISAWKWFHYQLVNDAGARLTYTRMLADPYWRIPTQTSSSFIINTSNVIRVHYYVLAQFN